MQYLKTDLSMKDFGKETRKKAKDVLFIPLEMYTKVSGKMVSLKDMESLLVKLVLKLRGGGRTESLKEKDLN